MAFEGYPSIQVMPKQMTENDWLEALSLAMKADIGTDLRKQVVTELLLMRQITTMRRSPA